MLNRVFAVIGLLGVVAFMGVVTMFVMEPDLWIVTLVVLAIAAAFIWQDLRGGGNHVKGDGDGDGETKS
jgi:uncharacterized membrane protein